MTNDINQARALAVLINDRAARLATLKGAGRDIERRCRDKQVLHHLATVYEIALYCMVLRPHEPDLLRLQFIGTHDRDGLFTIADRLRNYAGVCDAYHRRVLHDGGVTVRRDEWVFKEPDTPPKFPERIELTAECFTPITRL